MATLVLGQQHQTELLNDVRLLRWRTLLVFLATDNLVILIHHDVMAFSQYLNKSLPQLIHIMLDVR